MSTNHPNDVACLQCRQTNLVRHLALPTCLAQPRPSSAANDVSQQGAAMRSDDRHAWLCLQCRQTNSVEPGEAPPARINGSGRLHSPTGAAPTRPFEPPNHSTQPRSTQTSPHPPKFDTDLGHLCPVEFLAMVHAANNYADVAWLYVHKNPTVSAMDCVVAARNKLAAIRRAELAFVRRTGHRENFFFPKSIHPKFSKIKSPI